MEVNEMNVYGFLCLTVNNVLDYIGEIEDKGITKDLAKIYLDLLALRNHISDTMPGSPGEAEVLEQIKQFAQRATT